MPAAGAMQGDAFGSDVAHRADRLLAVGAGKTRSLGFFRGHRGHWGIQ